MNYKQTTLLLTLIVALLIIHNVKIDNAISLKDENIKILETEIDGLNESLQDNNSKLAKYESIISAIDNIDLNKNDYTYYPIENLTIMEQEFIYDIATANNFSFELVLALLKTESNFQKDIISNTNDWGIAQIHKPYASYYASLANLDTYDLLDFEDSIKLSIANLNSCREYWLKQYPDIPDEVLIYNILGSYNRGISGFTQYCKNNNTYITDYAQIVLNYKTELEQSKLKE